MKKICIVCFSLFLLVLFAGCSIINPVTKDVEAGTEVNGLELITVDDTDRYVVTVKENNLNVYVLGSYNIIYEIRDNDSGEVKEETLTFNVVDNTAPVIDVADEIFVIINEDFDPLTHITIKDNLDKEIPLDSVVVETNVNKDAVGSYSISYKVSDSNGNEANVSAIVNVLEKPNKIGDRVVTKDICQLTISNMKFATKVVPEQPTEFSSSYEVGNKSNTYLDVVALLKNLGTKSIVIDDIVSATLYYNNKYEYPGFYTIEEGGDFEYSNITQIKPLTTAKAHFLFEVPKEVEQSDLSLTLIININGTDDYRYKLR